MDRKDLINGLKIRFPEDLFQHSLGTAETASRLALFWGAHQEQADLAGLLHDYARTLPESRLLDLCRQGGVEIDPVTRACPVLLHGPAAVLLLPQEAGIDDQEVLEAIRVHTTGLRGMGPLAKALYLADYIEPNRKYPRVESLRQIALENPEKALLAAADSTILYVIERGWPLHPATVDFRNSILLG